MKDRAPAPAGGGVQGSVPGTVAGPAAAAASKGTPLSGACSNMPVRPTSPSLSGIEDLPPVGPSAAKKRKKSSVKKFSAKSRASGDSRQSAAGLCRRLEADLGAALGPSSAAASPGRAPLVPVRSPASTARKSGRVSNSGERVVDRAARRAAARDLPPSGLDSPSSPSPPLAQSPVRLVLPSHSDEHLLSILADVGICLDASVGSPSSLLQLIRANERAQADIAKAKEAGTGMDAPLVVAGGEPGEVARGQLSPVQKRGAGKRAKTCKAPCRSSLRIKNLSLR